METAQPIAAEHINLVEDGLGMVQLCIPCSKHTVPKQRDLLLQWPPGIDHAVEPVCLTAIDEHQAVFVHMVASDEIFVLEGRWTVLGM